MDGNIATYPNRQPASSLFSESNQGKQNNSLIIKQDFALNKLKTLSPRVLLDPSLDAEKRYEAGFSFIVLHRYTAGARELANSIKLCPASTRTGMLRKVGDLFMDFGDSESAFYCYRDGLMLCKTLKIENSNTNLYKYFESRVMDLDASGSSNSSSVGSYIRKKEKSFAQVLSHLTGTNEIQAQMEFYRSQLELSPLDFASRNRFVQGLIKEYDTFNKFNFNLYSADLFNEPIKKIDALLNSLVDDLVLLPNLKLYENILTSQRLKQLLRCLSIFHMGETADGQYDQTLSSSPETYQQALKFVQAYFDNRKSLMNYVEDFGFHIKIQLINAICSLIQGEIVEAKSMFCKVTAACRIFLKLSTIETMSKGIPRKLNQIEKKIMKQINQTTKTLSTLFCTKIGFASTFYLNFCYIQQYDNETLTHYPKASLIGELDSLVQQLMQYQHNCCELQLIIKSDWVHGIIGKMYEIRSFFNSSLVQIKDDDNFKKISLNKDDLELMIYHYTEAMRHMSLDDPCCTLLHRKVLWGMLMHGGFHLQAFWIVKFLGDYSQINSDCSLISNEDQPFFDIDPLGLETHLCEQFTALMEKLYHQRLSSCERTGTMFISGSTKFILPELLYDRDFSLIVRLEDYSFLKLKEEQKSTSPTRLYLKGILKNDRDLTEYCNKMSDDLIHRFSYCGFLQDKDIRSIPMVEYFLDTYYDGQHLSKATI
ncbi:hypothetical protein CANARDRAFT_7353 [[Candida] arabinofermentans NRRL YB-2248]|uniref:Uncharacterized protein n=1 Tax=[Candida] arabinofermentans NRRL YB-2248 TaxID=983967 RepID=A0A1E4T2P8_9ASCO|nr:hypothetical protein CANARDRAFT_7353 [[Candida] arabinofermentans NRRL YB-2248]